MEYQAGQICVDWCGWASVRWRPLFGLYQRVLQGKYWHGNVDVQVAELNKAQKVVLYLTKKNFDGGNGRPWIVSYRSPEWR